MRPSVKVITLAVDDLERSLRFYRDGLGLPTQGIIGQEYDHGSVVFFNLQGGLILALYPAAFLAEDAKVTPTRSRVGAVSIGHIVRSKAEVGAIIEAASRAGAIITDLPKDRFWGGYSGYFQDPDGHLWEITWHPELSAQE
ncbi:VOC family protein [Rhodoligotrophos defluvii]|uniref:VOC family protein n=1 Tax=Rhodoligotrophos defluvii TaxID=2561934 RepID=UPI0010C9C68E|nr:VOC family protein [Rhodoligotrophos defluvii]